MGLISWRGTRLGWRKALQVLHKGLKEGVHDCGLVWSFNDHDKLVPLPLGRHTVGQAGIPEGI